MTGGTESEGFEPETTRPSLRQRETGSTPQGVTRWRKRPVVIDAMHWDGAVSTATIIIDWMLANGGTARYHDDPSALSIDTLEGTMTAVPGDYIIRGVAGEFYSCREEIFQQTYEPADGDQVTVSREDLRTLLADNELTTEAAQVAYGRLSAAAEVTR